MSVPSVSIVVPVYGAEQYIVRCLRSLFGQTLDNIEYVFIDDCSPDRSHELLLSTLEEFPHRKEHVKIIRHEKNQGVSRSRQDGVDAATGEYIIHCDPDDFVEPEMYSDMYAIANSENADMVICGFLGESGASCHQEQMTSIELLERICGIATPLAHGALWSKLIRRSIAKSARFPVGVSYCEDVNVMFQILRNNLKIVRTNKQYYHYNYHQGSICTTLTPDAIARDAAHVSQLLKFRTGTNPRFDRCVEAFAISMAFQRIFRSGIYSSAEFKKHLGYLLPLVSSYRKSPVPRICMRLALRGYYHPALMIFKMIPFKSRM